MCSRYSIEAPQGSALAGLLAKCGFTAASSGEVRPSQRAPVLIDAPQGAAVLAMDWGFPAPEGGLVINARSETAAEKPLFRNAVMARRCVLPAASFYEWDGAKRCHRFFAPQGGPLYLAGLYQSFGGRLCFVILTRPAVGAMCTIHDRMPLLLGPQDVKPWLHSVSAALPLLCAAPPPLQRQPAGDDPAPLGQRETGCEI